MAEPPRFNIRRYRLLESTREFVRRRHAAEDMAAARLRLLRHLLGFYEQANEDYKTMSTTLWLGRYAPDLDNIRENLDWALYAGAEYPGAVRAAQHLVCEIENLVFETPFGGDWHAMVSRCVQLLDEAAPRGLRIRLRMTQAGGTTIGSTKVTEITRELVAWRREPGNEQGLGNALVVLGMALLEPADPAPALACFTEAEALFRGDHNLRNLATCLGLLAYLRGMVGDLVGAEALTREALRLAERIGCRRISTEARNYLMALTYQAGRVEEAIAAAHTQILRCREAVQPASELYASFRLLAFLLHNGQRQAAREVLPGLLGCYTGPHLYMLSVALHAGLLAAELGRWETAARLAAYAQAYTSELGLFTDEALDQTSRERTRAILEGSLPAATLAALEAECAKWDEKAVLALLHGLCEGR